MKTKAVAFIRVSTLKQDLIEQRNEVLKAIQDDGYKDEDIIIIEIKASTIKLDQSYMDAIAELESVIKSGQVNCIYIWALNRLTRKIYIATRFAEVLEKSRVRLKILNPRMELFNGDEFGIQQKMLICNMATVAEMEMELKQKDFKRTKESYKKSGKFCGGKVKFGYTLNESNHFIEDKNVSEVIRKIFEWYATGEYNQEQIYDKIYEMGYNSVFENREYPIHLTYMTIGNILRDASYIGQTTSKTKDIFPPIIPIELFQKVQRIRGAKNSKLKRQKYYFFGSKLIECPKCGCKYIRTKNVYRCQKHNPRFLKQGVKYCDSTTSIALTTMDSILWEETKLIEFARLTLNNDVLLKNLNATMDEINTKIEVCIKEKEKLDEKENKIEDIYLANGNKEKYLSRVSELKIERKNNLSKMVKYQDELKSIQSTITNMSGDKKYEDVYNRMMELETTTDVEMMNDLVHQLIHKVTVVDEDGYKIVRVYPKPIYGNVFVQEVGDDGNITYYNEEGEIMDENDVVNKIIMIGGNGAYKVVKKEMNYIYIGSIRDNEWHQVELPYIIHHDAEKYVEIKYKETLEERMKKYTYSTNITSKDIQFIDDVMSRLKQIKQEKGDISMEDFKNVLLKK